MVVAISSWTLDLHPNKKYEILAERDFRVTNAAYGVELAEEKGRSVVKVSIDEQMDSDSESDEEEAGKAEAKKPSPPIVTYLCSLRPSLIEHAQLDITFLTGQTLEFSVSGKNVVHLSGNYIDQEDADQPPFGGSDFGDSEDEYGYRMDDISSDVEMDAADLGGLEDDSDDDAARFEEIDGAADSKGKKRPRDSDASGTDGEKLGKNQKKKLAKKLKGEDGAAVPAGADEKPKSKADKPKAKADGGDEKPKSKADGEKPKSKKDGGEKKTLAGGLIVQDTKVGTGPAAKKGQKLSMRYIGKLTNGKVFDKNTGGAPFKFTLGKGEVIKGWDQGLVGMQVGGERVLTVPAAMAYGKTGAPPDIPPNSTLTFEVKLVNIA